MTTEPSSDDQAAIQALYQKYEETWTNRLTALEGSVSDTAYLVCESRARRVDISQDVYARRWIAPGHRESVAALWETFSREVYPYDDLEASLRTRYWLEQIEEFVRGAEDPVFVNIGAGLTSYPFLLTRRVPCLEFDRPVVVAYKNARMKELRSENVLPSREVSFCPINLESKEDLEGLEAILRRRCASRPSFVLCEGLTYYLERSTVNALVDVVRRVQQEGSILGVDFWRPSVAESPVFLRMKAFFSERFGLDSTEYTFLDDDWVSSLEGYESVASTTVVEQEAVYTETQHLQDRASVLLESYAVLKRTQYSAPN